MSMMIRTNNSNRRIISLKDINGNVVGTISYSSKAKKKPKHLQYNFKEISTQLMSARSSVSANTVAARARQKVMLIQKDRKISDYDDKELENAIAHAKRIERIARKRVKHLKEEEALKRNEDSFLDEVEEKNELLSLEEFDPESIQELSEEELKELIQELQESLKELEAEMSGNELTDELTGSTAADMKPEDLERLKKKHRSDELREIMEADMKYLKAMFEKLAKEKQSVSSGVSLQLDGMDIPVETPEIPVPAEGGTVDISV